MESVVVISISHEISSRYNGIKYIIPIVNILTDQINDIATEASMTLRDIFVYRCIAWDMAMDLIVIVCSNNSWHGCDVHPRIHIYFVGISQSL